MKGYFLLLLVGLSNSVSSLENCTYATTPLYKQLKSHNNCTIEVCISQVECEENGVNVLISAYCKGVQGNCPDAKKCMDDSSLQFVKNNQPTSSNANSKISPLNGGANAQ